MSIQFLPEYFTQQRPSKSEQIFQQLEPVGKSLGKSLQNTIQGYYDQQKEDRQAELGGRLRKQQAIGLAQAYKHPEWSEALGNFEAPQQIDLAKQLSESSPASMVLSKLINGGRFEAPEPVQQPAPTAQSIAANQAAAQRMGMANQEPGQIPGMPEYAQPGQQGPLPQYQPAMGQEEPAATPAEVVPPEPTKGQGNGLDLASFQGKRLGDMSIEQLDALKDGQPAQVQKQLEDAYNRQQAAKRGERNTSAAERNADLNREKFQWNKDKSEREELKDVSKDYKDEVDLLRGRVRKEEDSLNLAKTAIESGDTNSWSQFVANRWNIDPARTSASQLLNLASKEFTIGSLTQLSAKGVNQWIEQRFTSMFPTVGSKKDSQETVLAALKRNVDIDKKEIELFDKYSDVYGQSLSKLGKIRKYVNEDLDKYRKDRDEKLGYEFSLIKEKFSDAEQLYSKDKAVNGEYITPKKLSAFVKLHNGNKAEALNDLKNLGYKIPTKDQYLSWTTNEK